MFSVLQAGRALAALAVVAVHLTTIMSLPKYGGDAVFSNWTARGGVGVDFFFVLSGFIILLAHTKDIGRASHWGNYLQKRFVRLYPIYWIYTALFVGATLAGLGETLPSAGIPDVSSAVTLVRFSDFVPPLPQAWTLFHEVMFYAIFSIAILDWRIGGVLFAAWYVAILAAGLLGLDFDGALGTALSVYNLNFAIGMAACVLFRRMTYRGAIWTAVLGLCVSAISLAAVDPEAVGFPRLGWAIGFGLLIAGAAALESQRGAPVPRPLRFLGDASYSVYLTHAAFISVTLKVVEASPLRQMLSPEATFALAFAAATIGGSLAYLFVEKPMLARMRMMSATARSAT